jgi:O-antigen ligase
MGVGFNRIIGFVLIFGVFAKMLTNKKRPIKNWIINLIFISFFTLLSFMLGYDKNISILFVIGLNILVFISLTNLSISKEELKRIINALFISIFLVTIFFLIMYLYDNLYIFRNSRFSIIEGVNENRFGMMLAQLSAFCFAYIFYTKKRILRLISFILSMVNIFFVILTGSRSALIGVIVGVLFSIIIFIFRQNLIKKSFFTLILFILGIMLIFYMVAEANPILAKRMSVESVISSQGTRRWPRILNEIKYVYPNHPFLGVGPSSSSETIALSTYMMDPGSSHNIIISSLIQVGLLGFISYYLFFVNIFFKILKEIKTYPIFIIPLTLFLTAVFNGVGEVIYTERLFWNTLSIAALCLVTFSKAQRITSKNSSENYISLEESLLSK